MTLKIKKTNLNKIRYIEDLLAVANNESDKNIIATAVSSISDDIICMCIAESFPLVDSSHYQAMLEVGRNSVKNTITENKKFSEILFMSRIRCAMEDYLKTMYA